MIILTIVAFAVFAADMGSTLLLMGNYWRHISERGVVAKKLFKWRWEGTIIWCAMKICFLGIVIEVGEPMAILVVILINLYAVVTNIIVYRRVRKEQFYG